MLQEYNSADCCDTNIMKHKDIPEEVITRFLSQSRQYLVAPRKVTHRAKLLPHSRLVRKPEVETR